MKKTLLTFMLLISFGAEGAKSIGAISLFSQSIYKDTKNASEILPTSSYSGENFYLKIPEFGYQFLPNNRFQSLTAGIIYEFSGLNASRSSDTNIKLLTDRDSSIMAFSAYRLGPISVKVAQDISGTHDGYYAQLAAAYPVRLSSWTVIPSISYRYMDSKLSDHLFGVSQKESTKTSGTISIYDSPSTTKTTYGIRAIYPLTKRINTTLSISHAIYDEHILKSDIIERNTVNTFIGGIIFSF